MHHQGVRRPADPAVSAASVLRCMLAECNSAFKKDSGRKTKVPAPGMIRQAGIRAGRGSCSVWFGFFAPARSGTERLGFDAINGDDQARDAVPVSRPANCPSTNSMNAPDAAL